MRNRIAALVLVLLLISMFGAAVQAEEPVTLKWKYETGGYVDSSPAVGPDGTVYVGSNDNHLYAIAPDGNLKWKYETGNNIDSSPAIAEDGTVYFGSADS